MSTIGLLESGSFLPSAITTFAGILSFTVTETVTSSVEVSAYVTLTLTD